MTDHDSAEPFACPRCAREVVERFWGPCASCRDELAATMQGDARQLDGGGYVPKMNVVPNHVATKD